MEKNGTKKGKTTTKSGFAVSTFGHLPLINMIKIYPTGIYKPWYNSQFSSIERGAAVWWGGHWRKGMFVRAGF